MKRLLLGIGLVALVAAAVIAANIALLGYATSSSDPVGNVSPRISLPHLRSAVQRPPTPASPADREDD
ncbi:MAG TPA: hypothetical protein VEG40_06285 [Gaiellaceae bacterium]|nr:hypothetical protein [Gaiellaceae bacterium]HYA09967.1 hypothetical protein [Gaiellaceae bacterium]